MRKHAISIVCLFLFLTCGANTLPSESNERVDFSRRIGDIVQSVNADIEKMSADELCRRVDIDTASPIGNALKAALKKKLRDEKTERLCELMSGSGEIASELLAWEISQREDCSTESLTGLMTSKTTMSVAKIFLLSNFRERIDTKTPTADIVRYQESILSGSELMDILAERADYSFAGLMRKLDSKPALSRAAQEAIFSRFQKESTKDLLNAGLVTGYHWAINAIAMALVRREDAATSDIFRLLDRHGDYKHQPFPCGNEVFLAELTKRQDLTFDQRIRVLVWTQGPNP